MTSKTSFFKSLREDARHRIWVPALSCVVFLFGLIAATLVVQSITMNQGSLSEPYMLTRATEQAAQALSPGNPLLTLTAITGALICALQGFSYLFSRKQLDFYHALPVKRQKLFLIRWFNGVLFYAIPALIFTLLSLAILLAFGVCSFSSAATAVLGFLHNLLVFLLVYHAAIFFSMLCGNLLVTLGLLALFSIYAYIIVELIPTFMSVYYTTYQNFNYGLSSYLSYLAPAYLILHLETESSLALYLFTLLFAAVLLTGAVLIYMHRPSEAAGKAIAFKKLQPVFRILIVIPLAIYAGLAFGQVASGSQAFWSIFGLLFFAVLIHVILNVIFAFDIHAAFTCRKELIFSAAVATLFMSVFVSDILKLDDQIPSMNSVEAVYIDLPVDNDIPYINLSNGYYLGVTDYRESHAVLTGADISLVYDLLEYRKKPADNTLTNGSPVNLNVRFVRPNGHSEYRNFQFSLTNGLDAMAAVFDTKSYKQGHYQIFDTACDTAFDTFDAYDPCGNVIVRSTTNTNVFTADETKELLQVLRKDLGNITLEQMTSEIPLGTVSLQNTKQLYSLDYRIYPSFTHTVDWLTSHGIDYNAWKNNTPLSMAIYTDEAPTDEDVTEISSDVAPIDDYATEDDPYMSSDTSDDVQNEYLITDPELIRSIYPYLYSNSLLNRDEINYAAGHLTYNTVIITFSDPGSGDTYSASFSLTSDCDLSKYTRKTN